MPDLLCFGEPPYELSSVERDGEMFFLPGFGGDTSNCAIAAARQGAKVGYLTAVGGDSFGTAFLDLWTRERIDIGAVRVDPDAPTGIYFAIYEMASTGSALAARGRRRAGSLRRRSTPPPSAARAFSMYPASARRSATAPATRCCRYRGRPRGGRSRQLRFQPSAVALTARQGQGRYPHCAARVRRGARAGRHGRPPLRLPQASMRWIMPAGIRTVTL